jgi:hypothetical protein
MGLIIGPTPWWQSNLVAACPVGTTLLDGSRIICKAGGTAWIVAPNCTQVNSVAWAGGQYNSTLVGDKCCICEWSALNTLLLNCGFNPCDWFVPSIAQLCNPGYTCRSQWDTCSCTGYWSSTECSCCTAAGVCFIGGTAGSVCNKVIGCCVRAFRCVTY